MTERLRVLCLDIEGGFGGSSRSLFEFVRHLDRNAVTPEVWCRRAGPIQDRYAKLGVACRVTPDMPKVSSLPRLSRNLFVYGLAARDFLASRTFRRELLATVTDRIDLVHLNHEALFLLARWLKPRTRVPVTMHIRTNLHDTAFARWQNRVIAACTDHLIYISENERRTFERLSRRSSAGTVIHNIVGPLDAQEPHPKVPKDDRLKIACLSNYSWYRGLDRLVEVAEALAARGRRDILFVLAGNMRLTRSLPGDLGKVARRGGTLEDFAAHCGVADMFQFLGHVDAPERVLAACDLLVKPTRENNPWGRDILEALAMGRPVLSVGRDTTFVQSGQTGILQPEFDAGALADEILRLADDQDTRAKLGQVGQERILHLCDGPARATDLLRVWQDAVRAAA